MKIKLTNKKSLTVLIFSLWLLTLNLLAWATKPNMTKTKPIENNEILAASLKNRFILTAAKNNGFPSVVIWKGQIIPEPLFPFSNPHFDHEPRCRVYFEKNFAPNQSELKRVNPNAEKKQKMFTVTSSKIGELKLEAVNGEWNDNGPPIREIVCSKPDSQTKLSIEDLQKIFRLSARLNSNAALTKTIVSNWKSILSRPIFRSALEQEPCVQQASNSQQPTSPQNMTQNPQNSQNSLDTNDNTINSMVENSFTPPHPVAPLMRAQKEHIQDKLKELADEHKKIQPEWQEVYPMITIAWELEEKKQNELLSIDEMKILDQFNAKIKEFYAKSRIISQNQFDEMERIFSNYPGHNSEIAQMYWEIYFN